jgi:glycosyltransferase involved in cell wall biosynthesis
VKPLVSVVIPSYNHAAYVTQAVRSVLEQTMRDLEVLVVDDGSRDDSLARVRAIEDPRLRVIAQENRGTHGALNRGFGEAQGRYLAILNSDDRYLPQRLEKAVAALEAEPGLALVGTWIEVVDAEGRQLGIKEGWTNLDPWPVPAPAATFKADGDPRTALLMQNYWATTSNYVLPRESYETFGPFRPLRFAHDWDFALRVQHQRPARLLPEPLLQYRVHSANTIRENRAAMVYEICWVMAVHLPRYLGEAAFWQAGAARRAGQLLRSIHVYGCDAVLWGMAALIHQGPPGMEERLLTEGDETRALYLAEIRRTLEAERTPGRLGRWVRRLRGRGRG